MKRTNAVARMLGATMLAGTLAFSAVPAVALAANSTPDAGSSQMEAPGTTGDASDAGSVGEGGGAGDVGTGSAGGADTMTFDYTGTYTGAIEADGESVSADSGTYEATATDEAAALAQNGGTLALSGVELAKSGDDTDGDACNFYGVNSILLAVGESSFAAISSSSLAATSEGSNGIFATDSATVYAYDVSISTTADNSRGLDATYGGTIIASSVGVDTQGDHCASVATDRGGGYVSLTDATLATAGSGSPLLYSTGDVEVSGVTGTATGSQIAGMEGLNTILINDSTLESTVTSATASDPIANGVIIYQSTSGDAEATTGDAATFQVANSTLISAIESGAMFYLTNTEADVVLYNSTISFDSESADLLLAAGNDSNNWGSAGSNGATVTLTAIQQELAGTIEADTISSVDVYLTDSSTWTGSTVISTNSAGNTSEDPISVNVDSTSVWVVSESCELSSLVVAEGGQVVDEDGNAATIVVNDEVVVEGSFEITVTVESYSTDYDASGAGSLATELIDRSGFDEYYETSTSWTMGDVSDADASADETTDDAVEADEEAAESEEEEATAAEETSGFKNPVLAFFSGIGTWFMGLFS